MYNLRIIEYPTGYQVRFYSCFMDLLKSVEYTDFGTGEVVVKKLIKKKEKKQELESDTWYDVDFEFEQLEQEIQDMQRRKAESLRCSMIRTKSNLYYIARSNVWDWFITLTLDPAKVYRYDFKECSQKVRKAFNHFRERKAPNMYYLLVPEQHLDGAWHFHGLIGGCEGLTFEDSGYFDKKGRQVFNLKDFKLGFTTATKVTDTSKVSSYICKYITKTLCSQTKGLQRYWVSKSCSRARISNYVLDKKEFTNFRRQLIDLGCWYKVVESDYVAVNYFEVPLDQLEVEWRV